MLLHYEHIGSIAQQHGVSCDDILDLGVMASCGISIPSLPFDAPELSVTLDECSPSSA